MGIFKLSTSSLLLAGLSLVGGAVAQQQQQDPKRKPPQQTTPTPHPVAHPLPPRPPQRLVGKGWTITYNGWRKGYTPYPGLTIYRTFRFRRYLPDPDEGGFVVISPFYLYPNLPPFINGDDGSQANQGYQDASVNTSVQQTPSTDQNTQNSNTQTQSTDGTGQTPTGIIDSDQAVSIIKNAWESGDSGAITQLTSKKGLVKVSVATESYSLEAADFQDLISDGIGGTKTVKMTVVDQHVQGDQIQLEVLHTFVDPWQKARTVYQSYLLVKEDGGYVIRQFSSDTYNPPNSGTDESAQSDPG